MRAKLEELELIGSRIFGSEPELAIAIYNTSAACLKEIKATHPEVALVSSRKLGARLSLVNTYTHHPFTKFFIIIWLLQPAALSVLIKKGAAIFHEKVCATH